MDVIGLKFLKDRSTALERWAEPQDWAHQSTGQAVATFRRLGSQSRDTGSLAPSGKELCLGAVNVAHLLISGRAIHHSPQGIHLLWEDSFISLMGCLAFPFKLHMSYVFISN